MANVDKRKFRGGFWLGFLSILLLVAFLEVARLVPVSGKAQILQLKASLSDVFDNNADEASKDDNVAASELTDNTLRKAHITVGEYATRDESSQNWRWVRDAAALFEIKIPTDWHLQYLAGDKLRLLNEQGGSTGIEIDSRFGRLDDLKEELQSESGVAPVEVNIADDSGLVAQNQREKIVGFNRRDKIVVFSLTDPANDAVFEVILSSVGWL